MLPARPLPTRYLAANSTCRVRPPTMNIVTETNRYRAVVVDLGDELLGVCRCCSTDRARAVQVAVPFRVPVERDGTG